MAVDLKTALLGLNADELETLLGAMIESLISNVLDDSAEMRAIKRVHPRVVAASVSLREKADKLPEPYRARIMEKVERLELAMKSETPS